MPICTLLTWPPLLLSYPTVWSGHRALFSFSYLSYVVVIVLLEAYIGVWTPLMQHCIQYSLCVCCCSVTPIHESSVISAESYILFYEYSARWMPEAVVNGQLCVICVTKCIYFCWMSPLISHLDPVVLHIYSYSQGLILGSNIHWVCAGAVLYVGAGGRQSPKPRRYRPPPNILAAAANTYC